MPLWLLSSAVLAKASQIPWLSLFFLLGLFQVLVWGGHKTRYFCIGCVAEVNMKTAARGSNIVIVNVITLVIVSVLSMNNQQHGKQHQHQNHHNLLIKITLIRSINIFMTVITEQK